jgi:type II secretory pathway component PulF
LSEQQELELAKKAQVEKELEDARAEVLSFKMTNEEYRKTLKTKNSSLTDIKRELDLLNSANSGRLKELEFTSG